MREIKFRIWDKKRNVLVTSDELLSLDYTAGNWACIDEKGYGVALFKGCYELMQYTGLKDKNGREVYEGDILKVNGGELDLEFISSVTFARGAFRIKATYDQGWPHQDDIEVIGNIYEHPELLQGEGMQE